MNRFWTVTAILLLTCAFGSFPCLGHEGEHPGAAAPSSAGEERRFVDFTLPDPDGAPVTLGRLVGKKPVLLLFWAAWCPICTEEVPEINRIHRRGDMEVLAVNVKESPKRVKGAIRSLGIGYPVLLDPDGSVAKKYGVPGIPACVVIDRSGKIVYNGHSFPHRIETYLE